MTTPSGPFGPDDDQPDLQALMRALMGGDIQDEAELAEAMKQMGLPPIDPAMFQMVQAQVQAMMAAPDDEGFNTSMATDVARRTVSAGGGDPSVGPNTTRNTEQVVQVAQLWLDAVTDFTAHGGAKAWSRSEWVEHTMPTWQRLVGPIAEGVGGAMRRSMGEQMRSLGDMGELGLPPGAMDQIEPMLTKMSNNVFALQAGQAVGTLATEMLSGTEVGLPLVEDDVVMLPTNIATFAEGLELDAGEVHLYLAVREAARVRLFASVPWLAPALLAAVQSYAGDIDIDTEAIERTMSEAQTQDPEELQRMLQNSMFRPEPSEAQKRALAHLETLLALVEGWVDHVSERAVAPHLPNASALAEAVRRRRASGGPAEKTFSSLVGLELRPRRMRDAANLFAVLENANGAEARDGAWSHPDHAPQAADLDDPMAFAERSGTAASDSGTNRDEMDDELDKLLSQGQFELDQERKDADGGDAKNKSTDDDPDAK